MNSGPPTQGDIDYACPLQGVRPERKPRSLFMLVAVFVALCVALCIVAFAFGLVSGFGL